PAGRRAVPGSSKWRPPPRRPARPTPPSPARSIGKAASRRRAVAPALPRNSSRATSPATSAAESRAPGAKLPGREAFPSVADCRGLWAPGRSFLDLVLELNRPSRWRSDRTPAQEPPLRDDHPVRVELEVLIDRRDLPGVAAGDRFDGRRDLKSPRGALTRERADAAVSAPARRSPDHRLARHRPIGAR